MKPENINTWLKVGLLRVRQPEKERVLSMVESAQMNVEVVKGISADEKTATVIFREIYESVRQLGDALWWVKGYEPANHVMSLEILKDIDIHAKVKLNFLERFKKIRHDANYRGFKVSASQAEEIIDFWNMCSKDIIHVIKEGLKSL